ncbi:MAG: citrate lyase subunit alpha, partial [Solobacterium sp.]|nr:citrate lyase subunit alpha [Solobacterium sp.]
IVTDYGIAINPKRQDLLEVAENAHLPIKTIEELRDIAYHMAKEPAPLEYEDKVVAIIEARDGTIMDAVRKRKDKI